MTEIIIIPEVEVVIIIMGVDDGTEIIIEVVVCV